MGNVLLSQARKCWFCWFWVCFIFLSFWKNQFIFSDGWCRPLFPLQLHPLTLSWNIKWVHKDEAFVSTALSPFSWYDAIPVCILTINRLWFAPGLFCFFLSFWTVKLRPSFSSAMLLLASCSFLSIDAMCLTKSDWVLSTVCFSWDSFSLRSAMSLSFPKRVCLRKPISFSVAVKTQINITITHYRSLNNFKVWAIKLTGKTQKTELSITEREAGGRGGWQHVVKWFPSSRALFFSCMRDHIKLTVNLCFKVDDLLC